MTPYTKQIVELHKIHKAIENCGCNKDDEQDGGSDSGNLLMSLIPSDSPKPDLFLYQRDPDSSPIDVTNYKIDDFLNLYEQEQDEFIITCLYESSNLGVPITKNISFGIADGETYFSISSISDSAESHVISYNNKNYYYYSQKRI